MKYGDSEMDVDVVDMDVVDMDMMDMDMVDMDMVDQCNVMQRNLSHLEGPKISKNKPLFGRFVQQV